MKMSLVRGAEALRWRGYYPLLPLWVEYRNVLRAGLAAVVKNDVRLLLVRREVRAGVDKRPDRRQRLW